jgi:hypothetical protein
MHVISAAVALVFFSAVINANVDPAQGIKTIPLKFKPGTSSATVTGSVKGDATNDYKFKASGGQTLTVKLTSKNSSLYFNILPAERQQDGVALEAEPRPVEVTEWQGKLPEDGEYIIRVYLVRAAARRGSVASYSLRVEIK